MPGAAVAVAAQGKHMAGPNIFICYRRDDSARYATLINGHLKRHLANHGIFMDVTEPPGTKFRDRLTEVIATCKVMLVVIGPEWLDIRDDDGRRLDNRRDFVRFEVATALERDVIVIPVLVGGAQIPKSDELPDELAPLVERSALTLRDDRWDKDILEHDVSLMVATLRGWVGSDLWDRVRDASRGVATTITVRGDKRRRRRAGMLAALLFALGVAGVIAFRDGSPDPRTIRIGVIHSRYGDGADAAVEARAGMRYAVDYINRDDGPDLGLSLRHGGGLPGVKGGARLVLVDEDVTSRDIRQARCDVRKAVGVLASKGVAAVIGAYESTLTLQAIFAGDKLELPVVTDASSATPLTTPNGFEAKVRTRCGNEEPDVTPSPWFSRVGPNDARYSELFAQLVRYERGQHRTISRVAVLHPRRNIVGNAAALDAERAIKALGHVDVKQFDYDPTAASSSGSLCKLGFVPELRQRVREMADWDAQVVIAVGYTDQAVATVQAMSGIDYSPQALLTFGSGFARPDFAELVATDNLACDLIGTDARGIITRAAFSPDSAGTMAGAAANFFKAEYGQEMTSVAAVSFTATMALAQAIDAAGSPDHRSVQTKLRELQVSPVQTILLGGIRFDSDGQNQDAGAVLLQLRSDGYKPVYPRKLADSEVLVWPWSDAHG